MARFNKGKNLFTSRAYKAKTSSGRKPLNRTEKSQVKTISKRVLRNDQEWKNLDITDSATVSQTGTVYDMTPLGQGDTSVLRDGNYFTAYSIQLGYILETADYRNIFRVIVFQWTPDNSSTAPGPGSILYNTGTAYSVLSPYNLIHVGKGKAARILYDKIHNMNPADNTTTMALVTRTKVKIPKRRISCVATATTGLNHVYLLMISDLGVASHPSILHYSRCNFTDS